MVTTILVDRDLEGYSPFIEVGWRETGWGQLLVLECKWLVDFGLPADYLDQEIWRFVQAQGMHLVTSNRNREDDTSLQATIERENTPEALAVITIAHKESLLLAEYRQSVAHKLADILLYPEDYRGTGRVYVP